MIAIPPPIAANRLLPNSATNAMMTGAATTYINPTCPPGIRNERDISVRVRRNFHAESTVSTVVADRSQI